MAASLLLLGIMVLPAAPAQGTAHPAGERSIAVLGINAKQGVQDDAAALLSTHMVSKVREAGMFTRVVSTSEMKTALSFEAQKQLNNCDSTGCMAEIAGALGVDFILVGELGRLGGTWLLSLTIIDARTGLSSGSVSRSVEGLSEAALITAVEKALADVLKVFSTGAAATVGKVAPAPEEVAASPDSSEGSHPARRALMVAGAGALALAGAAGVGFLVAGVATVVVGVLPFVMYLWLPVPPDRRDTFFNATLLLGGGVSALAALGVLVLGAGGGAGLAVSGLVPG
jgi:hypothetical protein